MDLSAWLARIKPYQYVGASIVVSILLVSTCSLIFQGRVTADYLATGFITSLFVSSLIVGLITTYQKKIETQNRLLNAEKTRLAELNREKNEIFGIVAHDLKNPLMAVALNANLVKQMAATNRIEESQVRRRMENVEQIVQRMDEIVDKLLNLNALETGKMTFSLTAVDMVELADQLANQYRELAAAKEIAIHLAEAASGRLIARADQGAATEILDNLLSNAVKYSPRGCRVWLRLQAADEMIRLEVQDEGPGLTEEDLDQLFKTFTRLSAQPTGGERSTGLGLSIAQKLVKAMAGRIWCESEYGHGATFVVELPKHRPADNGENSDGKRADAQRRRR